MASKKFRAYRTNFLFSNGIAHNIITILRGNTFVLNLLEESYILSTIKGVDYHTTFRQSFLDLNNNWTYLIALKIDIFFTNNFTTKALKLSLGNRIEVLGKT